MFRKRKSHGMVHKAVKHTEWLRGMDVQPWLVLCIVPFIAVIPCLVFIAVTQ